MSEVTVGIVRAGGDGPLTMEVIGDQHETRQYDMPDGQEEIKTVRSPRIRAVKIFDGNDRIILTRFCTSRPDTLPGTDPNALMAVMKARG